MDKQDAYEIGKDRGQGIGSYMTVEMNEYDKYMDECSESEMNARQYSDFSFIAHDLNAEKYPDELWDSFEDGLIDGYREAWSRSGKQCLT